nr:MAG TPA: hypothetical protein [Caudoviricetes sp.]
MIESVQPTSRGLENIQISIDKKEVSVHMADSSHGRFYGIMVDMFCENNTVSLTRVISAFSYLLFAFVSIWLMATGASWSHYDIFASYTGAGGAALQLANKFVNSKYNSASGSYDAVTVDGEPINQGSPAKEAEKKPFVETK